MCFCIVADTVMHVDLMLRVKEVDGGTRSGTSTANQTLRIRHALSQHCVSVKPAFYIEAKRKGRGIASFPLQVACWSRLCCGCRLHWPHSQRCN